MAFQAKALNPPLTQDLDAFLQAHSFPDLYRAYAWESDTYENGFPDIYCLESRLVMADQTTGITLSDVKCVAKWGAMRNQGRIAGAQVVLPPRSLHAPEGAAAPALDDAPLAPVLALQASITGGVGPIYLSKVLRFGLPQEYGAIDTRCVRTFGQGDADVRRHNWIELSARNHGYGWYIPKAQGAWPREYATWINILRYLAMRSRGDCPHPTSFVRAGLRREGVWECGDVEMALFSYASQFTERRASRSKRLTGRCKRRPEAGRA
jgi:hypothetical protein